MKSNFDFLQTEFPVLSTFGCQAEKYCFSDPNSCLSLYEYAPISQMLVRHSGLVEQVYHGWRGQGFCTYLKILFFEVLLFQYQ